MASIRVLMIALATAMLFPAMALAVEPPSGMPNNLRMKATDGGLVFTDLRGAVLYVKGDVAGGRNACLGHCAEAWPPVGAPAGFRPQGDWGVVERPDGIVQLTFKDLPLHRFVTDPGGRLSLGWAPLHYVPPTPPHVLPAGIELEWRKTAFVYADTSGRPLHIRAEDCSDCDEGVRPLQAPAAALAVGDWRPKTGKNGARYWSFRGEPVYVLNQEKIEIAPQGVALLKFPS